jgi:hypothetical protein
MSYTYLATLSHRGAGKPLVITVVTAQTQKKLILKKGILLLAYHPETKVSSVFLLRKIHVTGWCLKPIRHQYRHSLDASRTTSESGCEIKKAANGDYLLQRTQELSKLIFDGS